MASVFISSPAEIVVIDSRTKSGTVTLPVTNTIPYRVLNFKDQYGSFSNSTLTLSTQVGESFDDGTTSKTFNTSFGYLSLYSVSSKWLVMDATQTVQQTISSLTVNQLTFGTGAGWVQFGPVQATVVSSIQMNTQTAYLNNVLIGTQSTVNSAQYNGLFGNYNNTVLAEISTGAGTQELLVFKGSSISDRVRIQTTGSFVVEPGVSARLFNSNTTQTLSNVTPAFIVNASSNVGIQTATPGATLDVAGTGRFQTVSSLALTVSSINGSVPGSGGITTANLVSTTNQLQSNITNWSQYPTTSDITLSNTTGITVQDPNNALQLKSEYVTITGLQGGYGNLSLATASFLTSSSLESYSLGFSDLVTGTVSSFFIGRSDGVSLTTAPIYISSVYFGDVGGTVAGQLTTDGTATDIFWKGSKLNNQSGGGGGGAIDYISAFTVSTGSLEVSTISSYAIFAYGVLGTQFVNMEIEPMAITSVYGDMKLTAFSNIDIRSDASTIVNANEISLNSSNEIRVTAVKNVYIDGPQVIANNIFVNEGISTYSMTIYGPSTLTVQGMSYFQNIVSSAAIVTNTIGIIDSLTGQPSYIEYSNGSFQFNGGTIVTTSTVASTMTVSSLTVDSLTFGDGNGWAYFGAIQAVVFSSIQTDSAIVTASSITANYFIGDGSLLTNVGGGGIATIPLYLSTETVYTSSLVAVSASISSLTVDSLTFGDGNGWAYFGAIQAVVFSSIQTDSAIVSASSITANYFIGDGSLLTNVGGGGGVTQIIAGSNVTIDPIGGTGAITINASGGGGGKGPYASPFEIGTSNADAYLGFYGTDGMYTQSVVAEVDIGGGNQELVLFRGSNATDRIRMQTTGPIVFESGVSARVWPSALSNVTPAMVIDITSNVGIQTATPATALDVAGTGRFQEVSTIILRTNVFYTNTLNVAIQMI